MHARGGSRVLRGGSLSQFYDQNVCESAFAALWLGRWLLSQLSQSYAENLPARFRARFRALSHAHTPSFQLRDGQRRARFGSYLRCRCVPEAKASRWTLSHASAGAGRREACMIVCVRVYVNDARCRVCSRKREGDAAELRSLGFLLTTT